MKNSQNIIYSLQDEKSFLGKKLQQAENEIESLQKDIFQLKERNFLLDEEKKNAEIHYNSVFLS